MTLHVQSLDFLHKRHVRARSSLIMTGSALLLSSLLLIVFLSLMMRSEWIDDGVAQAKMVAATSNAALLFGDEKAAGEILSALEVSPSVNYAGLTTPDGKLLAYHQRGGTPVPQASEAKPLKPGQAFGLNALVVIEPVRDGGRSIGFITMHFSLKPFYQRLLGYIAVIMAVALGALLIVQIFLSRMRGAVNRAEQHLEFLAHSDPVTMLPNRRAFNAALDEAILLAKEQGSYLGLILLDLDNFKVVNDTMGHQCGDEILRMVAHRIRSCMRDADLVFRLGGDEFVAILGFDENPSEDLYAVAQRLLVVLAQPFSFEEHEFFLTASIGSSLFPADAEDSQNLIRKADTAMYSAKVMGKNTFATFAAEMDSVAQRRLLIDKNLRRALERNELAVHYQPQVNIAGGRIDGVEVLLRWNHPEMGFISPAEFIPVAEESGLIVDVGKWVLRAACEQMAAWGNEGIAPDRVAVNLSIRQVRDPALMGEILRLLQENGLTAEQLELEITEGLLMENVQENILFLEQLQQAGIKLSVDDFGTGYSSLSYLKRFPVNQLKIDRSFMHDIPGEGEAFITAIIAMAHKLGLSVVAEGVETREQLEFLRESGCDTFQGFYFARPMPATQVADLLRNNH